MKTLLPYVTIALLLPGCAGGGVTVGSSPPTIVQTYSATRNLGLGNNFDDSTGVYVTAHFAQINTSSSGRTTTVVTLTFTNVVNNPICAYMTITVSLNSQSYQYSTAILGLEPGATTPAVQIPGAKSFPINSANISFALSGPLFPGFACIRP